MERPPQKACLRTLHIGLAITRQLCYDCRAMAIKTRSLRLDDEVMAGIDGLKSVYGTVNAGMRAVFGLGGMMQVKAIDESGTIPKVTVKNLPPNFEPATVVTKVTETEVHHAQPKVNFKELAARASQRKKK